MVGAEFTKGAECSRIYGKLKFVFDFLSLKIELEAK